MEDSIKKMLSLNTWVVAGSTHDPAKYAHIIYKKLKNHNYNVFSLNPSGKNVDEDRSYKTLFDLPVKPDVINMVINPVKGREIISDAIELGVKHIWFQPGADTDELIDKAEKAGITVIFNRCVLVELG